MKVLNQLLLLLWKNFTLRRRQPARIVVEIVWPLCLFLILVAVRMRPDIKKPKTECHYNPNAMPSAGAVPFLQSYVCNFDNACNTNITEGELGTSVNSFNNSLLIEALRDLEVIIGNNLENDELERIGEDLGTIRDFYNIVRNSSESIGSIAISSVVVDMDDLRSTINNQGISLTPNAVDTLLNASLDVQKLLSPMNETQFQDFLVLADDIFRLAMNQTVDNDTLAEGARLACEDELLLDYFNFEDEASALDLQAQICNLTTEEAVELIQDFADAVNTSRVVDEVGQIIEDTAGRRPNLDLDMYQRFAQLYLDAQNLDSMLGLFNEISTLASDLAQSRSDAFDNVQDIRQTLGRAICGNGRPLFSLSQDNEEDMEREFDRQDNRNRVDNAAYQKAKEKNEKQGLSPLCAEFFANLESSQFTRIIWRELKPIVLGVIPYTPNTPAVQKLMKEASRTFDTIASFLSFLTDIELLIPGIERFLEEDIMPIREFVASSGCKSLLTSQDLDPNLCDQVSQFIALDELNDTYTWRNALDNVYTALNSTVPYFDCFRLDKFVGYDTLTELIDASLEHIDNNTLWAALVFDNLGQTTNELPPLVKYRIRMDTDKVDSTKKIMDKYWRPGNRARPGIDLKYFTYGFIFIQDMVDHAIIRLQTNQTQEPGVYTQQFPYPCWTYDSFMFAISRSMPLFMVISWIYTVAMIVKGVVYEKEMRLKEVMKMMGLSNGVHWLAWFINAFVMMIITAILFVILLKVGNVLEYSDPSVVFVFMLAFTVSTISQCFLISVFFSKANLAAVCGGFIYFVLYLPYTQLVQWEDEITTTDKILASLSSNIAMGYCCNYLALYEEQAIGVQWSNIGKSPIVDDEFNMEICIIMMFLDALIYFIITWYIEAVFPGDYGIPRKWYFVVQKSYWLGTNGSSEGQDRMDTEIPIEDIHDHRADFEAEPTGMKVGVAVRNLRKIYHKADKVAVDGLSINFYEDQITSFLGHNGAGKTTTMSILTGLFPPTSGTAYIYGKNVRTDVDEIRHSLGMCPQHNVLFDLLTVEEHIWFYARLKGSKSADVKVEMEKMLQDVGLPKKRKEKAQNLSGGMKRKLSVAIAFVGGSRTVILDEPTAGVDPYARRAIWELLLKYRKGRTIILSTHHMDEADILGDRIAIISQGKLCTVGSSLFLKDRFGSGYYLTLVREEKPMDGSMESSSMFDSSSLDSRPSTATSVRTVVDVQPAVEANGEDEGYDEKTNHSDSPTPLPKFGHKYMVSGFSLPRLTAFVEKFVPGAEMVEDNSMEVCFRLPENEGHAARFQQLFAALEVSHRDMGISSYGISDTSLEEVFLKVAEEHSTDDGTEDVTGARLEEMSDGGKYPRSTSRRNSKKAKTSLFNLNYSSNRVNSMERLTEEDSDTESIVQDGVTETNFSGAGQVEVTGRKLVLRQMAALFLKRFHHVRRSKKGFISEILLPAGFVCLAMVFSLIMPPFSEEPPLELQPWMYEPKTGESSLKTFYSNEQPDNLRAQIMEDTLLHGPYFGNRCMNTSVYTISGKSCKNSYSNSLWTPRPILTGDLSVDSPECSCSSGFQRCSSKKSGGPTPSMRQLPTNDDFFNMTSRNISDWLVKSMERYMKRRFGGFSFGEQNTLGALNSSQISTAVDQLVRAANNNRSIFSGTEQLWEDLESGLKFAFVEDNTKVWFNNKGWAASVSYMNALNNVILRSFLPAGANAENYGIVTINHPMNLTKQQLNEETLYNSAVDVVVAICVIFAMSFVPASFVLFLIEERMSNSKHLQFVSGINPTIYWVTNWLWDMMNYAIPALLCVFIFLAFQKDAYVSSKNFPCLLALLFLYGWAMTPMMYPFSRLFDIPSSAFVALSCVNVFIGTVSTLATFILELLSRDDPDLADINKILKQVFLLLPHYCLGRGLIDMASYQLQADVIKRFGETLEYDLFDWTVVGRNLFAMFMMGIMFSIINLLVEYKFFLGWLCIAKKAVSKQKTEDIDVAREKQRVLSGAAENDVMRLEGLSKVYWTPGRKGRMTAVDHLYVGVPKGQCFGLLGVNGAGKTTTFKMLTGDVAVTEGDAYINGYSICRDMVKVQQFMGYCPQFDALDPLLTGREHLEFYARVRGIPAKNVKEVAEWAIRRLGLLKYADKISSNYSGGNKRKLSTAIALIGNPPIIFLDEPTTGMDPGARRFLWNCINNIIKSGRSVILTSHSMEECEALCSRLAIMVNGSFQCLGSIQHLKNRFGNGYTIILRVSGHNPDMQPIMQFISSTFPSAKLREKHHNMLQYQLGTEKLSLSKLFEAMEQAKQEHSVEFYSVSQTTLDQVFINFAKKQNDLKDDELDEADEMEVNSEDDNMDNMETISNAYHADSLSTGIASELDDQSVSGSTFELIRPGSGRSQSSHHGNGAASRHGGLSNVSIA